MKRTKFYLKEDKRWGVGDGGGNGMTDTGLWNIFVDREFIFKSIKFPYPLKFCHCWLAWNQQTVSERFWIIDWDNSFVSADKHYPRKALPCFPEFWQGGSRGSDLSKFQSLLPARVSCSDLHLQSRLEPLESPLGHNCMGLAVTSTPQLFSLPGVPGDERFQPGPDHFNPLLKRRRWIHCFCESHC